jgi:molecular chaperone DnaK (HSP70)
MLIDDFDQDLIDEIYNAIEKEYENELIELQIHDQLLLDDCEIAESDYFLCPFCRYASYEVIFFYP